MGSKFVDLYLAEPKAARALVRGDDPERLRSLARSLEAAEQPLAPAFEVMARGTFCFLPKGVEHAEGLVYCRAFERLLRALDAKRWGIELYPDESEDLAWDLAFGSCEADWLSLPVSNTGLAVTAWRAPRSCYSLAAGARHKIESGSFEARYISESTLEKVAEAADEGFRSGHGLFTIYQA